MQPTKEQESEDQPPSNNISSTQVPQPLIVPGEVNQEIPFYPNIYHGDLDRPQKALYRKQTHRSLIKSIKLKVVQQLEEAESLWIEFSPRQSLFDTWEFRSAFYHGYRYEPHFIVLKTESEVLAVLPLWYEEDQGKYFWFGSWWNEDNTFFVKDQLFIPLLLAAAPKPIMLNAIKNDQLSWLKDVVRYTVDDPKFVLDIGSYSTSSDFLNGLKKKRRYNIRRDVAGIDNMSPKVTINNFSDFKHLVAISKLRFAQKGEVTDWEDDRRVKAFEAVINNAGKPGSYEARMLTVKIGNRIAAVDLVLMYNQIYYPVKCAYDVARFPGIGNYVNMFEIQDALNLGMKQMDFLEINYGWKDKWFQTLPLHKYEK
jgi:hypothetical protein